MWPKMLNRRVALGIAAAALIGAGIACSSSDDDAAAAPAAAPAAAAPAVAAPATAAPAAAPAPVALIQKEVAKEVKAPAVPTPVRQLSEQTWRELYMSGPGYNPAWGEPKKGGIFRYGAS